MKEATKKPLLPLKYFGLIALALVLNTQAWADDLAAPTKIQIEVTFGDKITEFLISLGKNDSFVSMSSNQGDSGEKVLEPADAKFILEELRDIPPNDEATEQCWRERIVVTSPQLNGVENFKATTCLDAKTDWTQQLISLVNLLALVN